MGFERRVCGGQAHPGTGKVAPSHSMILEKEMLARALKLTREFHRLNQVELARQLDISKSYLSEIESGAKVPTVELLNKYAANFNLPVSTLLLLSEKLSGNGDTSGVQIKNSDRLLKFLEWVVDDANENEKNGSRTEEAQ